MKKNIFALVATLLIGFVAVHAQQISPVKTETEGNHVFRYTNPITRDTAISMRDHCIIKDGQKWYCTGTSEPVWIGPNPGVRLMVSDDLIHWKHHSWLIDASKLPADCPYNGRFWAPEIHFIQGTYWLTVNSGKVTKEDPKGMNTHSVWLFKSDRVTGPYTLVNGPLTPQYNNDATLFEDEDGQVYFYCSGNGLFQGKIDLNTGKMIGGQVEKFLDKKQPGYPDWMIGGIEGPFVIKRDQTYFMFFSTWTRGYEVGLLKSKSPLGPWELASREPIFGTRKKNYRPELAQGGGYAHLKFQDTSDPYAETGHNALFEGPDGKLWSSCHYMMFDKRAYPFSQTFERWEPTPQLGIEPVRYENGMFYIDGPNFLERSVSYQQGAIAFGSTIDAEKQVQKSQELAKKLSDPSSKNWRAKGDQKRTYYFDEAKTTVAYRVCVPDNWDGKKKLPMMVFLHGGGNNESSYLDADNKLMVKLANKHGYILVSPLGYKGAYGNALRLPAVFGKPDEAIKILSRRTPERDSTNRLSEMDVINVIELVMREYPVDQSNLFLTGHSMGSGGTWYLSAKYPHYWKAIAPMSGPFIQGSTYPWANIQKMKIFVSEGLKADASLEGSRNLVKWMNHNGFSVQYKEVNADHPGMVPLILPEVFSFFDRCKKNQNK